VKIILTQDVPTLGRAGDVKTVADGYAGHYLLPNRLAVKATPGALKEYQLRQVAEERREERLAARAEALAERLSTVTLTFEAKSGETGHLYGSITPADIAEALGRATGEEFDRRKHIISEPIRELGRHVAQVRLRADVIAEVQVVVTPEGGELPEQTTPQAQGEPAQPGIVETQPVP
jgi:large subunit ribosomal protein L9